MGRTDWAQGVGKHVLSGTMGLAAADALGVPVEFMDREVLAQDPRLV